MPGFDIDQYFCAVDAHREQQGLTWQGVARELNEPFAHRTDIPPIAASSLSGMRGKGALNGNIVVHTCMWLGRAPEEFTPGHAVAAQPLLPLVAGHLPRWDVTALRQAVEAERISRGLTWKQVVDQVRQHGGLYSASSMKNLQVSFPAVMGLLGWLNRPAADFVINVEV